MTLPSALMPQVDLPDSAGQLQRAGRDAALIREMGDDYDRYHTFVAAQLAAVGGRPDPRNFATPDAFLEAWSHVERIVRTEVALRLARAYRVEGRALSDPLDFSIPLIDRSDRLVSVTAGQVQAPQ